MRLFSVLFLAILIPSVSFGQVFRYKDEKGNTHYVDKEEKVPIKFRSQLKDSKPLPSINKIPASRFSRAPSPAAHETSSKKVEVFVTSWCPYCRETEAFLKKKEIRYTRYDVEHDPKGKKLYEQLGGGGVPVVKIGNQVIRGFDPGAISAALGNPR